MTEAEARIQTGRTGMGRGRGALKKERGIRMGKERRGGIQMKTGARTKIRKTRKKRRKQRRRRQ